MQKYNLDLTPKPRGFKFWYSFNKHKIPVYFTFLAFFFYTAFLDFDMLGTPFQVQSIISTIYRIDSLSAFLLFVMYLIAIIQLFNIMSYSKKLNPIGAITFTALTAIQAISTLTFIYLVFTTRSGDIPITPYMIFSIFIISVGLLLMVIANIFSWIYVNWGYVKSEE